jgi:hypothetical protein
MEPIASLYSQREWGGSENEKPKSSHKNSQLSNVWATKSLKTLNQSNATWNWLWKLGDLVVNV